MLKELDIKQALKTDKSKTQSPLYKIHKKDNSTIVVDEMCINNSSARADVVAINGELHCFEIKSDVDTFKRLENQMNNYLEIFDKIYFAIVSKSLSHCLNCPIIFFLGTRLLMYVKSYTHLFSF